jgi:hypothetical protein
MKFGITSIRQAVHPKAFQVSTCRYRETAVRPSDFSIENLVIVWYDGSWPTIVMSVPCSVVRIGRSGRTGCSISLAIQALVACGMA